MQKAFTAVVAMALMGATACGGSEVQRQAEQAAADAKKAAEAAAQASQAAGQDAAKGAEDFAKAMQGMASALSGGKTVEPVTFQSLEAMLPDLDGWEKDKPKGERMTSPMPYSQTETTYRKGDMSIDVKVVDSGFATMLIAPWSMMLAAGYSKETSDGYEKAVTVAGQPGFEKWDTPSKDGELNLVVNKRFLVSIEGQNLADTKILHDVAGKMDMARLAALK
jgi:hypothetical protein